MPPLELARHGPEESDAVSLLLQLAERAGRVDTSAWDAETLRRIAAAVDGLPLAIELAAARLTVMGPRALLARLGPQLSELRRRRRDGPSRHETLEATVSWSVRLLRVDERDALCALSVFEGDFDVAAAEAVIGARDAPVRGRGPSGQITAVRAEPMT